MISVTPINDLNEPGISAYRSLKGKALDRNGIFIAEGEKVVRALLKSKLRVISALMTEKWYRKLRSEIEKRAKKGFQVYIAGQKEMEKIVGFHLHQGIMATAEIPPKLSLKRASKLWNSPHLLLAVNGIKDPENAGLIVRNSVAFGVDTLIVDKSSCHPYLRRAVRVSIGTIFKLPVVYTDSLPDALNWLKQKFKTRIIAAAPGPANQSLNKTDFSGDVCLVFGNEERGLSEDVVKIADSVVRIPMPGDLDSLNVSCASAVFLHRAAAKR
jgi:tRNA G18 (ribose-2'-O)-methylase SpoU